MSQLWKKKNVSFKKCCFVFVLIVLFGFILPQEAAPLAAEITIEAGDSIQATIDQAQAGDILRIKKGLYEESIVISKTLTLVGEAGATIVGPGKGSVVTINHVNKVTISGLTIQNSGKIAEASGIYIEGGKNHLIEGNVLQDNHFGMYVDKGEGHVIKNNDLIGRAIHFSERGNGIHLYKGTDNQVIENKITRVQDGVYFDFTENSYAANNAIKDSRYGLHYMYSDLGLVEHNLLSNNMTGILVMDSTKVTMARNVVSDQFHVRGYGIMVYRSIDIIIEENEIVRNSTAISLEQVVNSQTTNNIVAANQVGLEFIGENENNIFTRNNFIANIVSSKIANEGMRLDDGETGNYWDDYGKFDLTGNGIGEERYKAGSLYDLLLEKQPTWQFFFESPAINLWNKAESMLPTMSKTDVYDELPAVEPFSLVAKEEQKGKRNHYVGLLSGLLIITSTFILGKGRIFK